MNRILLFTLLLGLCCHTPVAAQQPQYFCGDTVFFHKPGGGWLTFGEQVYWNPAADDTITDKRQMIYKPKFLHAPSGRLRNLYFRTWGGGDINDSTAPSMYPHLEIRLGRTRDAGYLPRGGPYTFLETVPVFKADSIVIANTHKPGAWIKFPINQAPYYFDYDSAQNLVVELRSGPGAATHYWGISYYEVQDTGHVVYIQGWNSNPIAPGPYQYEFLAGFGFDITPLGVGAEPSKTSGRLVVYPNPVQDVLRVSGALPAAAYQVMDLSGRSVQSGKISLNLQVSTSSLAPGSYLLQVGDEETRQVARFIKQ